MRIFGSRSTLHTWTTFNYRGMIRTSAASKNIRGRRKEKQEGIIFFLVCHTDIMVLFAIIPGHTNFRVLFGICRAIMVECHRGFRWSNLTEYRSCIHYQVERWNFTNLASHNQAERRNDRSRYKTDNLTSFKEGFKFISQLQKLMLFIFRWHNCRQ